MLEYLTENDVPHSVKDIVDVIGIDAFRGLVKLAGGSNLYIPTYKATIRNSRNREIRKRYNGVNGSQLAAEYGMSVNNLRNIVKNY